MFPLIGLEQRSPNNHKQTNKTIGYQVIQCIEDGYVGRLHNCKTKQADTKINVLGFCKHSILQVLVNGGIPLLVSVEYWCYILLMNNIKEDTWFNLLRHT